MFDYLASLPARRDLGLDCGTGNGQAAVGLSRRFARVIATDGSSAQLEYAIAASNVTYVRAAAEDIALADGSVDLVTAAQSLHWFDTEAFFSEAQRVLVTGGAIAVWGYGDPTLDDPLLQSSLHAFNRGLLEQYWPSERSLLLAGYRTIEFPFDEIAAPSFSLEQHWTLDQLTGLMRTWSATSRFIQQRGRDPVDDIEADLRDKWGDAQNVRMVRWPLYLRAGRLKPSTRGVILQR